jgi:hypothetical protein
MTLFSSPTSSAPAPASSPSMAPSGSQAGAQAGTPSGLAPLTEDDVKRALPPNLKNAVTQNLVDTLNQISTDPLVAENIRNNFVGYSSILKDGKFKTEDYVHAVAYVSYKLMSYSNEDAYMRTFPQRYASLLAQGKSKKDISSYVSAYAKGKLVNLILEQSMVPTWVLNQDLFQRALNVQAELMTTAFSEKVRSDAANSILTHLKKPEKMNGQINLDIAESNSMKDLKNMIAQLAENQQKAIAAGEMKTVDVAAQRLIDREGAEDV